TPRLQTIPRCRIPRKNQKSRLNAFDDRRKCQSTWLAVRQLEKMRGSETQFKIWKSKITVHNPPAKEPPIGSPAPCESLLYSNPTLQRARSPRASPSNPAPAPLGTPIRSAKS